MNFIINYFKRCRIPTKQEIKEYYPKYLLQHSNPLNKLMHVFGNGLTWLYVGWILFLSFFVSPMFAIGLLISPFIVYPVAWLGHFHFEKGKPATFKQNPVLTKICDNILIFQLLISHKLKWDTRKRKKKNG